MLQFIKFNIVGLANTLLDYGVFTLLIWLGLESIIIAQCISYGIGILNSYFFNKYWTFTQKNKVQPKQVVRFLTLNGFGLLLSLGLLTLFTDQLHYKVQLAKLLATIGTMLFNFAGNKLWVFRERGTKYS
jgi:putative flippase GtrA